jgi:hypothetical protein
MGDAPDFNDLVRDDPAAAWRACGRAKAHRPESGNGTGNLPLLDFTLWQGKPIPPRRWLVAQWLPWRHVTSLYGER